MNTYNLVVFEFIDGDRVMRRIPGTDLHQCGCHGSATEWVLLSDLKSGDEVLTDDGTNYTNDGFPDKWIIVK